MKTYSPEELQEILNAHAAWLKNPSEGARANLGGANLNWANLRGADLTRADLTRADLSRANLRRANLTEANLYKVDLTRAYLSEVNLNWANLSEANLTEAHLGGANLNWANLRGADLGVKNPLARAIRVKGACWEACAWVEKQNKKSWGALVKACDREDWVEWLESSGLWERETK